jgi:hypothetical protein
MLGYILLFLLLFAISLTVKNRKKQVFLSFLVIAAFSSIRYGISYDYQMYVKFITNGWRHSEEIPAFIEYLSSDFFGIYFFFIATSVFTTAFIMFGIYKSSSNVMLSVFLYAGFPTFFIMDLSIVRQAMASSLVFFLICLKNSQPFQDHSKLKQITFSLIIIFTAYLCHHSAAIAILLLFPVEKIDKKIMLLLVILSFTVSFFIKNILLNIGDSEAKFAVYLTTFMAGNTKLLILVYIISIIVFIKYENIVKCDLKNRRLLNLMFTGLVFAGLFFGNNPHLAMRTCSYFWTSAIIIIPSYWSLMKFNTSVFKIACISCFAYSIHIAHITTVREMGQQSYFYPYTTVFDKKADFEFK